MILWLEPNGVHCKLFYSEKLMKEFFQNRAEAGWPINRLCFELVKEGVASKFQVFGRGIQKGRGYVLSGGINNFIIIHIL